MSTKAETITKFHLYMDDTTELSSQEESDLYDKWYNKVMAERPWEICKSAFTGTMSTSVPYVTLPDDFSFLTIDDQSTDNITEGGYPVIFVGTNLTPYKVVNFSDRRKYAGRNNVAYIDIVNNNLVFVVQPVSAEPIQFDYIAVPAELDDDESPIFPARFHDVIYHGMCSDEFVIQQSDKAKSYRSEHIAQYKDYVLDMAMWNANLQQI